MKLSVCLASAALIATTTVSAAPQHGWHVRVHVHNELKEVSEICGESVACRGELTCVQVSDWYGACMKNEPSLMEQCGGHSLTGPWKNACVASPRGTNSTCVYISPYFSQCQDLAARETFRYKHHHGKALKALKDHDGSNPIALYGQCKWLDANVKCADGLQCITESDHYGQCRKRDAALYDQCGGKGWKQPWSATCPSQSVCVKRDEWYSQCLPANSPATNPVTPLGGNHPVSNNNKATANKWDQCGGASFHGPTECALQSVCVKHNNWYSQCKPDKLPVGELCAMNKADSTWSFPLCEGNAKCVVSTADGSESRCK